jgi:hypothetical protein
LTGPPYEIDVEETIYRDSMHIIKKMTLKHKLFYDTNNQVFYTSKISDDIFKIDFIDYQYKYQDKKWYYVGYDKKYYRME